ncbi:MAG: alpha/beta fold hydrolase [Janthinobacterium lividum]
MPTGTAPYDALTAPTCFAETDGRKLAYRTFGDGPPLILCVRFRGVLDVWDPAFLDRLAAHYQVVTFDYSGLGQSSGTASYEPRALAKDAIDLADALGIERFALGGWSLGGQAAQALTVLHPGRVTHLVLIGTTPPGKVARGPEPVFYERALKFDNDLADDTVLFFEPESATSRAAAKASRDRLAERTLSRSPVIPQETYVRLLKAKAGKDPFNDDGGFRDFLAATDIPILVISGDHEIVFPVHNWFDVVDEWQSLRLIVFPQAGHGVHHQYPESCGDLIHSFIANS